MDAAKHSAPLALPHNATTGQPYSGKNIAALIDAQADAGYSTAQWAGFAQWKKAGRSVRKGETATRLRRVVVVLKEGKETTRIKTLCVFNIAQTEEAAG